MTMKLNKKKTTIISIVSTIILTIIVVNIIIQRSKPVAQDNIKRLEVSVDSGKSRMWESVENQKAIYYDTASFSDEFNGFEIKINPLFLFYELPEANGSVGAQFYLNNKSDDQFELDTNNIEVVTSNGEMLKPAPGGNLVNQSIFNPNDTKKDVIVFFSKEHNIENLDSVEFRFEVINKKKEKMSRSYAIKFDITDHPPVDKVPKNDETTVTTQTPKASEKEATGNTETSPKTNSLDSTGNSISQKTDNEKQMKKYSLESDITSLIENKITNAEIDKIEVNEHLGTQEDGDYIALIHLKYKPKNSNETTLKLIDLYNNEIGAQLAKQKEVQEVTIFWEAPYIKEDMNIVKANLQRNGENMIFNDTWVAPLMK
ncbi:hypothetical protein OB975_25180 [Bacillus cereus]|nr:hypothetical protein [Bacillus cereus]MCU5315690.1 hypothetical protein [Bacillus cereus]MCU5481163.1 hypothetical protein [Bacillus cereus]